jgi:hypothetical protein
MSKVITLNSYNFRNVRHQPREAAKEQTARSSMILSMGKKKIPKVESRSSGSSRIALLALVSFMFIFVLISGAFYIYQVNDLATKGYEIKDIETKIESLEKESKKMRIREVELKSMYNIEKSTQDLNLVSPSSITYVRMGSSVAMK